ncbi:MAG: hypothetical protein A2808_02310 [Candidatus Moranbacteria bacterium RIFCSPHIGHO2_01_FULL_55_24]|nr:MAG: hypothetical protein A2808_02310 [Candidatus Moranbacteria bacterium RIFCSPHIGHO2_01_FULL_55_24]
MTMMHHVPVFTAPVGAQSRRELLVNIRTQGCLLDRRAKEILARARRGRVEEHRFVFLGTKELPGNTRTYEYMLGEAGRRNYRSVPIGAIPDILWTILQGQLIDPEISCLVFAHEESRDSCNRPTGLLSFHRFEGAWIFRPVKVPFETELHETTAGVFLAPEEMRRHMHTCRRHGLSPLPERTEMISIPARRAPGEPGYNGRSKRKTE